MRARLTELSNHLGDCSYCQVAVNRLSEHHSLQDMIKECPDWRTRSNSVPDLTKFLAVLRQTCVTSLQNEQLSNTSSQREYDVTSFLAPPPS